MLVDKDTSYFYVFKQIRENGELPIPENNVYRNVSLPRITYKINIINHVSKLFVNAKFLSVNSMWSIYYTFLTKYTNFDMYVTYKTSRIAPRDMNLLIVHFKIFSDYCIEVLTSKKSFHTEYVALPSTLRRICLTSMNTLQIFEYDKQFISAGKMAIKYFY